MKEIRGMEAISYAEREGILFNADEQYLIKAEGALRGRPATCGDVEEAFYEALGTSYDLTRLIPSNEDFNCLIERYGAAWIYVPVEGLNPKEEERVTLRLFRRLLRKKAPSNWIDIRELTTRCGPLLRNTGFAPDTSLNLLFHAALRLVEQEKVESVVDKDPLPEGVSSSYGRRRFIIPPDMEIYLGTLLCVRCRDEYDKAYLIMHYECALRLGKALAKEITFHERNPPEK